MSAKPDTTTTATQTAAATGVHDRLDAIERSVQTLTDGQWNKKDISAVVTLIGSISGLITGAYVLAQANGWL